MGGKNSVHLQLENGGAGTVAVYPGNWINGKLHLNVPDGIELASRGITISLHGHEEASWKETIAGNVNTNNGESHRHSHHNGGGDRHRHGSFGSHHSLPTEHGGQQVRWHHHKETILDGPVLRLDRAMTGCCKYLRGQYTFPFNLNFPAGPHPPTFMAPFRTGQIHVTYHVKAHVYRSGMFKGDLTHKAELFVAPLVPNPVSAWLMPSRLEHESDVTVCCCFKRGTCRLVSEVSRQLLTGNDLVDINQEVHVEGKKTIKCTRVRLMRECTVAGEREVAEISRVEDPKQILPGSLLCSRTLRLPVSLPAHQCSYVGRLSSCRFFLVSEIPVSFGTDIRIKHDVIMLPAGFTVQAFEMPPTTDNTYRMADDQALPSYSQSVAGSGPTPSGGFPNYMPAPPVYQEGVLARVDQEVGGYAPMPSAPPPEWSPQIQECCRG
eukprot:498625_1